MDSSSSTKENKLSPSAASDYKRYLLRQKVEHAVNKLRQQAIRCAGLIIAPCLLVTFVTLMGRYNHHNSVRRTSSASTSSTSSSSTSTSSSMPEVISQEEPICRQNAIAYMVRKRRKTGSFGSLVRSLDLLYENYLDTFHHDTHVFLFHLGDFDTEDLQQLEWRYAEKTRGTIQLVSLINTPYWQLPGSVKYDDPTQWRGYQDVQRLHDHRFWSIKVWDYFDEVNRLQGCNYRHVMRMSQESFIYSPIKYNIFEFAQTNNYQYSYRLCSYEMATSKFLWDEYLRGEPQHQHNIWSPDDCAFYNPFFVADLQFFRSRQVQRLLKFVDHGGYIYREDGITASVIHTMAVYAYARTEAVHRFLDFTFEHFERDEDGCPKWGGLQAGYNDPEAAQHVKEWTHIYLTKRKCQIGENSTHIHTLQGVDLSPTYSHLPEEVTSSVQLQSVTAGTVDLPNQGVRSG